MIYPWRVTTRNRRNAPAALSKPLNSQGSAAAGPQKAARKCRTWVPHVAPGATLIADRAYDTNAIRDACREKKAWANIPPRVIRKDAFAFSAWVYRQRNLIERFFNRIKQFRGLATRYDRSPDNFLAALKLVAVRIWLAGI